jgi:hypothetical protein
MDKIMKNKESREMELENMKDLEKDADVLEMERAMRLDVDKAMKIDGTIFE